MVHAVVSDDYRVAIPEEIRRLVPLDPGQEVGLLVESGFITLLPGRRPIRRPAGGTSEPRDGEKRIPDASAALEALAAAHCLEPVRSLDDLPRGWPEDELDDGFEEAVRRWRDGERG